MPSILFAPALGPPLAVGSGCFFVDNPHFLGQQPRAPTRRAKLGGGVLPGVAADRRGRREQVGIGAVRDQLVAGNSRVSAVKISPAEPAIITHAGTPGLGVWTNLAPCHLLHPLISLLAPSKITGVVGEPRG